MTRLTYPDASFDLVLTSETLEHVPDLDAALAETRRVLAPGGRHVFTVPLLPGVPATYSRIRTGPDGAAVHLAPPICHPGGDVGYPVFTEFGARPAGDPGPGRLRRRSPVRAGDRGRRGPGVRLPEGVDAGTIWQTSRVARRPGSDPRPGFGGNSVGAGLAVLGVAVDIRVALEQVDAPGRPRFARSGRVGRVPRPWAPLAGSRVIVPL